jgi:hypothetical protein
MMITSDLQLDRSALEQFFTVLYRLREETHAVVESGPTVIELVGGYILLVDPADSSSGFSASIHFAPPGIDGVTIAERHFEGGKADLFQFVIHALCDDAPNLKERLLCLNR